MAEQTSAARREQVTIAHIDSARLRCHNAIAGRQWCLERFRDWLAELERGVKVDRYEKLAREWEKKYEYLRKLGDDCLASVSPSVLEVIELGNAGHDTTVRVDYASGANHWPTAHAAASELPDSLANHSGWIDFRVHLATKLHKTRSRLSKLRDIDVSWFQSRLSFEWRNAAAWLDTQNTTGQPDNKTDNGEESGEKFPENSDVTRLASFIRKKDAVGETKTSLALQFTDGDEKKAASLLRQLSPSRFGHLLNGTRFEPKVKA